MKRVVEEPLVMLLANFEVCRIGERGGVGGGVGGPCMIVGRGRREGEIGCFDREAIWAIENSN